MPIDMTNVKEIMHGDKEVVKIEDSNGGILWQKQSGGKTFTETIDIIIPTYTQNSTNYKPYRINVPTRDEIISNITGNVTNLTINSCNIYITGNSTGNTDYTGYWYVRNNYSTSSKSPTSLPGSSVASGTVTYGYRPTSTTRSLNWGTYKGTTLYFYERSTTSQPYYGGNTRTNKGLIINITYTTVLNETSGIYKAVYPKTSSNYQTAYPYYRSGSNFQTTNIKSWLATALGVETSQITLGEARWKCYVNSNVTSRYYRINSAAASSASTYVTRGSITSKEDNILIDVAYTSTSDNYLFLYQGTSQSGTTSSGTYDTIYLSDLLNCEFEVDYTITP